MRGTVFLCLLLIHAPSVKLGAALTVKTCDLVKRSEGVCRCPSSRNGTGNGTTVGDNLCGARTYCDGLTGWCKCAESDHYLPKQDFTLAHNISISDYQNCTLSKLCCQHNQTCNVNTKECVNLQSAEDCGGVNASKPMPNCVLTNARCRCVECLVGFYSKDCSLKCPHPVVAIVTDFVLLSFGGYFVLGTMFYMFRIDPKQETKSGNALIKAGKETKDSLEELQKKGTAANKAILGSSMGPVLVMHLQIVRTIVIPIDWSPKMPQTLIYLINTLSKLITVNVPGFMTSPYCAYRATGSGVASGAMMSWWFSMSIPVIIICGFVWWTKKTDAIQKEKDKRFEKKSFIKCGAKEAPDHATVGARIQARHPKYRAFWLGNIDTVNSDGTFDVSLYEKHYDTDNFEPRLSVPLQEMKFYTGPTVVVTVERLPVRVKKQKKNYKGKPIAEKWIPNEGPRTTKKKIQIKKPR